MELHLRHYSPGALPTGRLIQEAPVPNHRLVARPSHWPLQQLRNLALQIVIGRKADDVLHLALFQRLVELRLGEGRVGTKHHHLAALLLALDLGSSSPSQPSALCTLPGRSFAARQSPARLNNSRG